MGEICSKLKLSHTSRPSHWTKFNFNPPPPPHPLLEKSLLPLIPSRPVYLLDFFFCKNSLEMTLRRKFPKRAKISRASPTIVNIYCYCASSGYFSMPRESRRKVIPRFMNSWYTEMYNSMVIRDKRKLWWRQQTTWVKIRAIFSWVDAEN